MTGLDLEIDWRLNDYFFLDASATFLDAKIEDHIGTCFAGQTVEQGCDVGCDPNTPSGSLPFTPGAAQDRSGIHLAPDLELNLGLRYQHLLASGASLRADVYVRYRYEFTRRRASSRRSTSSPAGTRRSSTPARTSAGSYGCSVRS